MQEKRVLFILPSLVMGGLERTQVTLANKLQDAGYDVTVMILDEGNELSDELNDGVTFYRKVYKNTFGKKVPYIRHKYYDDGMWETRTSPEALYRYYVGNEKFDVEIAFFHGLCVKIISGSTNRDAVHLTWIHNDFTKIHSYRFNFKSMDDVRAAYSRFDRVVCVSENARLGFLSAIGDTGNTTTVYNMLPVDRIRKQAKEEIPYKYPEESFNLVLVGRLKDSHKGQRRLISVISRLRSAGKKISLTLVGDGSDREIIERHIRKHHLEDRVFLVGSQKNPFPYIAGADALVCASYYEGFNLTVAEALILGVPVISTECTGPCEILDNGKYGLITENNRNGLFLGIRLFADHPEIVEIYREKAKERIDFFCEDTILKQITDLFEKDRKEEDAPDPENASDSYNDQTPTTNH